MKGLIITRAVTLAMIFKICSICSCKYSFKYAVYALKYAFYAIEYAFYPIEYAIIYSENVFLGIFTHINCGNVINTFKSQHFTFDLQQQKFQETNSAERLKSNINVCSQILMCAVKY